MSLLSSNTTRISIALLVSQSRIIDVKVPVSASKLYNVIN
jgi:hypothetical protein